MENDTTASFPQKCIFSEQRTLISHKAEVKRGRIYLQPLLLFSMASDADKQTDR